MAVASEAMESLLGVSGGLDAAALAAGVTGRSDGVSSTQWLAGAMSPPDGRKDALSPGSSPRLQDAFFQLNPDEALPRQGYRERVIGERTREQRQFLSHFTSPRDTASSGDRRGSESSMASFATQSTFTGSFTMGGSGGLPTLTDTGMLRRHLPATLDTSHSGDASWPDSSFGSGSLTKSGFFGTTSSAGLGSAVGRVLSEPQPPGRPVIGGGTPARPARGAKRQAAALMGLAALAEETGVVGGQARARERGPEASSSEEDVGEGGGALAGSEARRDAEVEGPPAEGPAPKRSAGARGPGSLADDPGGSGGGGADLAGSGLSAGGSVVGQIAAVDSPGSGAGAGGGRPPRVVTRRPSSEGALQLSAHDKPGSRSTKSGTTAGSSPSEPYGGNPALRKAAADMDDDSWLVAGAGGGAAPGGLDDAGIGGGLIASGAGRGVGAGITVERVGNGARKSDGNRDSDRRARRRKKKKKKKRARTRGKRPVHTVLRSVVAIASYEGKDSSELTFAAGDVIEVLDEDDTGWWEGRLRGTTGWFPYTFVADQDEGGDDDEATASLTASVQTPTAAPAVALGLAVDGGSEAAGGDATPASSAVSTVAPSGARRSSDESGTTAGPREPRFSSASRRRAKRGLASLAIDTSTRRLDGPVVGKVETIAPKEAKPATNVEHLLGETPTVAIALSSYEAAGRGELSFKARDRIVVLINDGSGWAKGKLEKNGVTTEGWFPSALIIIGEDSIDLPEQEAGPAPSAADTTNVTRHHAREFFRNHGHAVMDHKEETIAFSRAPDGKPVIPVLSVPASAYAPHPAPAAPAAPATAQPKPGFMSRLRSLGNRVTSPFRNLSLTGRTGSHRSFFKKNGGGAVHPTAEPAAAAYAVDSGDATDAKRPRSAPVAGLAPVGAVGSHADVRSAPHNTNIVSLIRGGSGRSLEGESLAASTSLADGRRRQLTPLNAARHEFNRRHNLPSKRMLGGSSAGSGAGAGAGAGAPSRPDISDLVASHPSGGAPLTVTLSPPGVVAGDSMRLPNTPSGTSPLAAAGPERAGSGGRKLPSRLTRLNSQQPAAPVRGQVGGLTPTGVLMASGRASHRTFGIASSIPYSPSEVGRGETAKFLVRHLPNPSTGSTESRISSLDRLEPALEVGVE